MLKPLVNVREFPFVSFMIYNTNRNYSEAQRTIASNKRASISKKLLAQTSKIIYRYEIIAYL